MRCPLPAPVTASQYSAESQPSTEVCRRKRPRLGVLAFDHLVEQVLHDEAVASRERLDERVGVGGGTQRDGCQLQPDRPPVRAGHDPPDQVGGELTLRHGLDQRSGLVLPKGEIGAAELHDLVVEPEVVQLPGQVSSGADHGPSGVRQGEDQLAEVVEHGTTGEHVRILEHEDHLPVERREPARAGRRRSPRRVRPHPAARARRWLAASCGATDRSAATRSLASTTGSSCRRDRVRAATRRCGLAAIHCRTSTDLPEPADATIRASPPGRTSSRRCSRSGRGTTLRGSCCGQRVRRSGRRHSHIIAGDPAACAATAGTCRG